MLFSIITVSRNSEDTISKTIESVLEQTYSAYEYVIIDGLSSDQTVNIAKSYSNEFKQKGISYKVVSEKDMGIYDAMNKGIRLSNGDLIGIINSDDWYERNALELVANANEKEAFDLLYADLRIVKQDKSTLIKHSKKMLKYITSRHWNHPTSFISKKIYSRLLYNSTGLYSDFDLFLQINREGYKIVVLNEVLANFKMGGASNKKEWIEIKKRIDERYSIYQKNGFGKLYYIETLLTELMKTMLQ